MDVITFHKNNGHPLLWLLGLPKVCSMITMPMNIDSDCRTIAIRAAGGCHKKSILFIQHADFKGQPVKVLEL